MPTPGKSWQCLITPGAPAAFRFWWGVTVLVPFFSKQRLGASEQGSFVYPAAHGGVWQFRAGAKNRFSIYVRWSCSASMQGKPFPAMWGAGDVSCGALWEWISPSNLAQYQQEPFLGPLLASPSKQRRNRTGSAPEVPGVQVWSSFDGRVCDIPRRAINKKDWAGMSEALWGELSWQREGALPFHWFWIHGHLSASLNFVLWEIMCNYNLFCLKFIISFILSHQPSVIKWI